MSQGNGDADKLFWRGDEIASHSMPSIGFYIDPLIPRIGTVLLYGKFGSYKTPLTVHIAHSIAAGLPFLGLSSSQAPVLYIEGDTPQVGLWPRLQAMNPSSPHLDFAFVYPGFNVVSPKSSPRNEAICSALAHRHREYHYGLVVIDSLRTSHRLADKDSEVPSIVYGALADLFPNTCVLVVHHDRKTKVPDFQKGSRPTPLPEDLDNESFSGSQAWIDRATTALKLRRGTSGDRDWISLSQTKSQVGPTLDDPIQIHVTDGHQFCRPNEITDAALSQFFITCQWTTKRDLDAQLAAHFGWPERLIPLRRTQYEHVFGPVKPPLVQPQSSHQSSQPSKKEKP